MEEVHIITWRYSDGSASGVIRAYQNIAEAEDDLDLLKNEGTKEYAIVTLPVRY